MTNAHRSLVVAAAGRCLRRRVRAASPVLGGVTPRGVQRGTDAVLFFNGARLADAQEILFYYPGFTVTKLEVVNDSQVKATVKIAADCRLGEHAVRVRTATGVSETAHLLGRRPAGRRREGAEQRLRHRRRRSRSTSPSTASSTMRTSITSRSSAKKGQRVSAEIEGMRLANTLFDPYIAILDMQALRAGGLRRFAAAGPGRRLLGHGPRGRHLLSFRCARAPTAATARCQYRLHVGTFPRPTAVVPAGGKPGEEVEVTLPRRPDRADQAEDQAARDAADGKFGVFAQDAGGISPSPMPFRLSDLPNVIETERQRHATRRRRRCPSSPRRSTASSPRTGEVDYYRFTAKKGQTFDVHCYARRLGSPLDSVMTIGSARRRGDRRPTTTPSGRTAISASTVPSRQVNTS